MQTIRGVVQKGAGRGKELGFPTINLPLKDAPLSGVYAGRVQVRDEAPRVAAIFADPARGIIEAHLLDFEGTLYGLEATLEVREKIRDTASYPNDEELKVAIADDIAKVRECSKN